MLDRSNYLGVMALVVGCFGNHLWTRAFRMFLHSWRLGLQWMEKTHLIEDPITWQEDLLQGEKKLQQPGVAMQPSLSQHVLCYCMI